MIKSKHKHSVLISFDVEEFDLPREHGVEISLEEGIKVSKSGVERILELLERCGIRATFFVTGNFASSAPELVCRMVREGHEVGCHGVDHFNPAETDVVESKRIIEDVVRREFPKFKVDGWRQPRMFKIDYGELLRQGFLYDSSVNPALIPGRYNHLDVPRKPFWKAGIVEVPVSVATVLRLPLFWLALHLYPVYVYLGLVKMDLRETGYFATYFHPWEFSDELMKYGAVPAYIKRNSGMKMVARLEKVILALKKQGCEFETYGEFARRVDKK